MPLGKKWKNRLFHFLHRKFHRSYPHYPQVFPQANPTSSPENPGFSGDFPFLSTVST
jgi:hypothetical protein